MIYQSRIRRKIKAWKGLRRQRRIIVLEDLKAGYLPVYKVASTSLRNLFCQRQAAGLFSHTHGTELTDYKKQVERRIRKSTGVSGLRRLRKKYFLFAFVRNPITRLYSCYLDKVTKSGAQGRRFWMGRYGIDPDMSFESFAKHIAQIPDTEADPHFRSQHFLIYHENECLVDFVGKFENLNRDWQRLAQKTGLVESPGISRSTGAGNGLDKLPLSREAAGIIARRYQQDIELFGYQQEIDQWLRRKAE